MYFDSEAIYEALKCSFCASRFSQVIKLIPDCGNSICEQCYLDLAYEQSGSDSFRCQSCNQSHSLPENGLPDDKRLMNILRQKPQEKSLGPKAQQLKTSIDELQEKVYMLGSFDGSYEIGKHCDELEAEIRQVVESAVNHLNKIESDLLSRVGSYRQRLSSPTTTDGARSSLDGKLHMLSTQINGFTEKWLGYFNRIDKTASDEDIGEALDQQREFESKINLLEEKLKSELFQGRLLVFRLNQSFFKVSKHIGELTEIKFLSDQSDACTPKPGLDQAVASSEPQTPLGQPAAQSMVNNGQSAPGQAYSVPYQPNMMQHLPSNNGSFPAYYNPMSSPYAQPFSPIAVTRTVYQNPSRGVNWKKHEASHQAAGPKKPADRPHQHGQATKQGNQLVSSPKHGHHDRSQHQGHQAQGQKKSHDAQKSVNYSHEHARHGNKETHDHHHQNRGQMKHPGPRITETTETETGLGQILKMIPSLLGLEDKSSAQLDPSVNKGRQHRQNHQQNQRKPRN